MTDDRWRVEWPNGDAIEGEIREQRGIVSLFYGDTNQYNISMDCLVRDNVTFTSIGERV